MEVVILGIDGVGLVPINRQGVSMYYEDYHAENCQTKIHAALMEKIEKEGI